MMSTGAGYSAAINPGLKKQDKKVFVPYYFYSLHLNYNYV